MVGHVQLICSFALGFPRQEYWSGLPFLSPGDLTNPGTKPQSLASPALADGSRLWILKPQPLEVRSQWQPPALRSNGPRGFRWPAGGSPELSSFPRMGFVAVGPSVWGTAAALLTQSSPTLCDPLDCSPPGSSVRGIFQARIMEWLPISFPQLRDRTHISRVSCISGRFFTQ